ncbi:unnamed protein product [Blepharisma stoltei]|uniref:ALA-interacting subunit n=1 Tax=Blepharisma stoltei TaxID=1481888 RepID=A0AAU9JIU3_9CILI|nr:unnamed protein product [Blepharisma stoltei]
MSGRIAPQSPEPKKNKPTAKPFFQQTKKGYRPLPTVLSTVLIFTAVGLFFILFGSIILSYSLDIIEHSKRYDNVGDCINTKWNDTQYCNITIDIDEDMNAPVFFYYSLSNFYQNHWNYMRSYSQYQLLGSNLSKSDLDNCIPVYTMKDLGLEDNAIQEGAWNLSNSAVAFPCGLTAKWFFNDTFEMWSPRKEKVFIHEDDIAWSSDKDRKFNNMHKWKKSQWKDVEDEHFMVWMRSSSFSTFKKLWGRIEDDLDAGTYTIQIHSHYDQNAFNGEKWVEISTASALGGKNDLLGIAFLSFGGFVLVIAVAFGVRGWIFKNPRDLHYD